MATAFILLSTALRDAITGAPALGATGKVLRGRGSVLASSDSKGVRIETLRSVGEPLDVAGAHVRWTSQLQVAVLGRATATQDAEQAIDDLLGQVWQRLGAIAMPAGSAERITVSPQITWGVDEADTTVAQAVFNLTVTHITTAAALEAPAS